MDCSPPGSSVPPLSMGSLSMDLKNTPVFLPFTSPRDLPDPGVEPDLASPALQGDSLPMSHLPKSAAAAAKSLQSCPILCDPIDGSPPGSSVPGILQARILEWVAISFSNA